MKKRRKIMGMTLAACMLAGTLGCGESEEISQDGGEKETNVQQASQPSDQRAHTGTLEENDMDSLADPVSDGNTDISEIIVAFAGTAYIPKDLQMIEDEINAITRDKINVVIDLQCFTIGDFPQQINLMMTSGEQVDLMCTTPVGASQFTPMCSQGQFTELDDLLDEYGQELKAVVGESLLRSTMSGGNIYGIPSYANKAKDTYYCIRTDIVEKYGLEEKVQNISSLEDIEEILETIKAQDGIVAPLGGKQTTFTNTYGYLYDTLDNGLMYDTLGAASLRVAGVVIDEDDTKVVNLYERDEYEKQLEVTKDWYEKGYIYKDSATYAESGKSLVSDNIVASYFTEGDLGVQVSESLATGRDMTCVKVMDGIIDSGIMRQFVWGIPRSAHEPEAAMKFLNMMYTDADIVNLLTWGIEGIHYEEKADGTIGFPEGVTSENSGYYLGGLDFIFGNCFLAKVWEGNDPGLREKSKEMMDHHKVSPIVGFSIDTTDLENEITALTNAVSEYRYSLECGIFDPKTDLKAFRDKLKSCGSQKYIEEVQRQLDEYLNSIDG